MNEEVAEEIDVSAVIVLVDDSPDLEQILNQYSQEFRDRDISFEFVLVFDGLSRERTTSIRERIPAGIPIRRVHFNQAFGEEKALASGFSESRGRILLGLPSYMQVDPGDVHLVVDALERDYDLVVGWRVPRVDAAVNRFQSWLFNSLMSAMTGVRLHDMNSGLVGMRRSALGEVLVEGNVSRFLPVLAHRKGFKVGEVRVRHLRERGKRGFFGLGVYVRRLIDVVGLLFITRFTRKPLRFFGVTGGVCVLLGAAVLGYLLLDYFFGWSPDTSPANRVSLVLGTGLVMLGVQIFAIGLVGEIIIFIHSRNVREYTIDEMRSPGLDDVDAAAAARAEAAEGEVASEPVTTDAARE